MYKKINEALRLQGFRVRLAEYERLKREYIEQNPIATHDQIQKASREFAFRCAI